MKKPMTIILVLAFVLIASAALAIVMDAPHNASTGVSCADCHNLFSFGPPSTYTDDVCLSCHNNATGGGYSKNSAPKVLTHSSANTDDRYGTWTMQCKDCHWKHNADQRLTWGASTLFLVTGTITTVTDNGDGTTTFGYSGLVVNFAGWGDFTRWNKKSGNSSNGNERGLIIYPNTANLNVSFEIRNATANTVTVTGGINSSFPGTVLPGSGFGLAYGQFINGSIVAPADSSLRPVKFFENSSIFSFAFNDAQPPSTTDPTPDGVCQVCHTKTVHWRNDGTLADHNSGAVCTICHRHEEGFKFSCVSCHESPPPTGKHAIHFDDGSVAYGTTDVQSTPASYSFSCGICHNGTHLNTPSNPHSAEVIFSGIATGDGATNAAYTAATPSIYAPGTGFTFNYSDGTCSNVYCHGNYPGSGKKASPTYNTGTAVCGSCHEASNTAPPASGSHSKHASQYNMMCSLCHNGEIGGAGPSSYSITDKKKHVNGVVDWAFNPGDPRISSSSAYNIPSGTTAPSNGTTRPYGNCLNIYCHSNGTPVATLQPPANISPAWGTSLNCTSCHDYPPSYANGSPKANSHPEHSVFDCSNCHVKTTVTGFSIADVTYHVNKVYDVYPNIASGITLTYTFSTAGGTCTNISCHGGNTATWGTSLVCQNCHLGPVNVEDFSGIFWNNGVTSQVASSDWNAAGHGRPAASGNYTSGNPAADFTATHACLYCHDDSVLHKTASNPFRLRNLADAVWGKNGVCQNCHANGSAGITVDSVLKNGSKKIGSVHGGAKHTSTLNGGQFCWDCHNPHGNSNIFMVQTSVAATSDANTGAPLSRVTTSFVSFATGTGYAKSVAPFNGVCNVCHTTTDHYTATSGDNHNADTRCTQCHQHTGSTTTDAFKPSCDGCHGNPPVDNTTLVGFVFPSKTGSATAGAHSYHVKSATISCSNCHANSVGSGPLHNTGDFKVSIGFSLFNGAYLGGAYNGQTTVGYKSSEPNTIVSSGGLKSCSNVYCHGSSLAPDGGSNTSPVWDNAATGACGSCHGASLNNPPTRGSHIKHTATVDGFSANRQFACSVCHNNYASSHVDGKTNWAFDATTYPWLSGALYNGLTSGSSLTVAPATYQQCSNLYCHSIAQTATGGPLTGAPGEYKTPRWGNSIDGSCGTCHDAEPGHAGAGTLISTGSHAKHLTYKFTTTSGLGGSEMVCAMCHKLNPAGSINTCTACHKEEVNKHVNHQIDVAFEPGFVGAATYNGSPNPGSGFANCSNTYCHSQGTSIRTGVTPTSTTPNWGSGALACNACHGNTVYPSPNNAMPNYANGSPKENSHQAHVINNGLTCANCHAGTTATNTSIASTSLHVNGVYDTQASGSFGSQTIAFTYSASTMSQAGSCSNISCHGGNSAAWGGTVKCSDCHFGAADTPDYVFGNGIMAKIGSTEWGYSGHGKTSGIYDVSLNPAANLPGAAGTGDPCQYCHDTGVKHGDTSNPLRLRNFNHPTYGKNGVCLICHATGAPGISGVPGIGNKTATIKIDKDHYGSMHSASLTGGQFCWDCHDGHGDSTSTAGPIYMVQRNPAQVSNSATGVPTTSTATAVVFNNITAGSNFANTTGNGICNVCHSRSAGMVHWYNTPPYTDDNHNATLVCLQCHKHSKDTTYDGNAFQGIGDCIGCHSAQQGNRVAAAAMFNANSHHVQGVAMTNQLCYQCHWEANADGTINSTYHGGPEHPGAPVQLVIYGNGARPTTYTLGTTAVAYSAGTASVAPPVPTTVKVVDPWTQLPTGSGRTATFTAGAGTVGNRMVLIGIAWEDSNYRGCNPSAITGNYGGQTITTINEANSSDNREGQWMGYIGEAGIAARSNNTITLTFSGCTPNQTPTISAATYEGVGQSTPPASATASGTSGSTFPWSGLPVVSGGYAMYNINANGISSFAAPATYTERYDVSTANFRMSGGDKAITANGTESGIVLGNTSSNRWALVAVSVSPSAGGSTGDASRAEKLKINQVCLGCHSAQNSGIQPFGDGKTPKQYAWDGTSVAERYSQTGTTPWGKYSGANVTPKNNQTKAFSAHGNAAANQRGWDLNETWPNTAGSVTVVCFDCHNSHGSTVAGITTSYISAATGSTNGGILKDTTAGLGGYAMTYKPQPGGATAQHNAYNPGAALCFDCHMTQNAGTTPWGYQGTFGATQAIYSYWEKPYWYGAAGVNPSGAQKRYAYKNAIGTVGGHFGASSPLTTQAMGTIGGLCTPCHDPHGVSPTLGANQAYAVPLLRGTWMTSPYKEDVAPVSTTELRGGGREAPDMNVGSTPLYHIDQNTFGSTTNTRQKSGTAPSWNFNSTSRVAETVDQFAGLCLQCHPKSQIAPTTGTQSNPAPWKSMDRIHNTVKGWGTYGGNANNAVHSYTCSKCHTAHDTCLPRLMITNCLDFTHRTQVASGGLQPIKNTESGRRGQGAGNFPGGGGGNGDQPDYPGPWFFGSTGGRSSSYGRDYGSNDGGSPSTYTRACHDNTNSDTYPANERWNVKTPWGTPGPPQTPGGGSNHGGWDGGGWGR